MKCFRKDCENEATVMPALPCKDAQDRPTMWAMAVPHCDEHTRGAVVDSIMTDRAFDQLLGMIRKEGLTPPDRSVQLHFVPLNKFSMSQRAVIEANYAAAGG